MEVLRVEADVLEITDIEDLALDPITVYWRNVEPGKGFVTITCWGCAWTSWFGAIGDQTIQEFFLKADTHYLVQRIGITQWHKKSRHYEKYLARIVDAVKQALLQQKAASTS